MEIQAWFYIEHLYKCVLEYIPWKYSLSVIQFPVRCFQFVFLAVLQSFPSVSLQILNCSAFVQYTACIQTHGAIYTALWLLGNKEQFHQ